MAINAEGLKRVIGRYHEQLTAHREAINRLNVYPVPDGDTGTNMSLTMAAVVDRVRHASSMQEVTTGIADGSLMGARGNSGVILSQILRGLTDRFGEVEEVGVVHIVEALDRASEAAYKAVLRPVEGTILTVLRSAAETARREGSTVGDDVEALLWRTYRRAEEALERTPDLLPVLRQAGVVDAGGAGFLLLLAAFVEEVSGSTVTLPDRLLVGADLEQLAGSEGVSSLRYEVMFFLDAADGEVASLKGRWADLGDSIVVVGGAGTYNCHIHTDDVGAAIEAGIAAGRPHGIKVTDLREQAGASHGASSFEVLPEVGDATIGVVAVAAGAGLVGEFRRLGAQGVVRGGQTMNPSTEDLLRAVESALALTVVLLPNNKNIIPVALQVDALTPKRVLVVPTRSVPQGIAAMIAYRPAQVDADDLVEDMTAAASTVITGEVTRAVRDAIVGVEAVKKGDWLGLADGNIVSVRPDLLAALISVLGTIVDEEAELVTIFTGEGSSLPVSKAAEAWLSEHRPLAEVQVVEGGQPLYPYLISVE